MRKRRADLVGPLVFGALAMGLWAVVMVLACRIVDPTRLIGQPTARPTPTPTSTTASEEYYRGVYALCLWAMVQEVPADTAAMMCNGRAQLWAEAAMHLTPAPAFTPPAVATRTP